MREVERSAPSVEEAIEAALDELGVSEQGAEIQILREPQKGLLGLGGQDALVRVRVREEEASEADLEEQAELAEEFLEGLLDGMGIEAEIDSHVVEGAMYVDIVGAEEGEGMGLLIGKHGATLEALQELVRSAVQRRTASRCRILVDVEDYAKRRRSQLADRARQVARRVRRTGRQEALEAMSPYERKIVHDAASEVDGVESASEGQEPDRRVVIRKKR
jgi:spoIIIJ-associated protein